jgi:hypothetical protein
VKKKNAENVKWRFKTFIFFLFFKRQGSPGLVPENRS